MYVYIYIYILVSFDFFEEVFLEENLFEFMSILNTKLFLFNFYAEAVFNKTEKTDSSNVNFL